MSEPQEERRGADRRNKPLIQLAGEFLEAVIREQKLSGHDGLTVSLLKDPESQELLGVFLSPCDLMHDGELMPRYNLAPDQVRKPQPPKLLIAR